MHNRIVNGFFCRYCVDFVYNNCVQSLRQKLAISEYLENCSTREFACFTYPIHAYFMGMKKKKKGKISLSFFTRFMY